jgi:iron complex transport system substrate-binding protein
MKKPMNTLRVMFLAVCMSVIAASSYSDEAAASDYKRIVSLLPSVTELLYALELEDNVVGVTRYCKFPPEAEQKPKVGGFVDVNYEALYSLTPDIVILQVDSDEQKSKIDAMGIETIEIETRSVEGILKSIDMIGSKFNRREQAKQIVDRIEAKISEVTEKIKGLPKPRVLVSYFREVGTKVINEVYIAGNRTYFHELIDIAGGTNAYQGFDVVTSPIVTAEGILSMNPDIIIEIISMANGTGLTDAKVLEDWAMLSDLNAFKNNKIYIFNTSYSGLPGPRLDLALADIAKFIHPEVDWGK